MKMRLRNRSTTMGRRNESVKTNHKWVTKLTKGLLPRYSWKEKIVYGCHILWKDRFEEEKNIKQICKWVNKVTKSAKGRLCMISYLLANEIYQLGLEWRCSVTTEHYAIECRNDILAEGITHIALICRVKDLILMIYQEFDEPDLDSDSSKNLQSDEEGSDEESEESYSMFEDASVGDNSVFGDLMMEKGGAIILD